MLLGRHTLLIVALVLSVVVVRAEQQPPRPFPQPSQAKPGAPPAPEPPRPSTPTQTTPPQTATPPPGTPDERTLGVPIYPTSQFLTSYDAGRGQRFYLFGTTVSFAEIVTYYRNALKARGDVLFETPPTHQFEIGRFREETMAFPPSVTVKDYTWGGSAGFPNPKPGVQPARFPTVIQIVPAPAGPPQ